MVRILQVANDEQYDLIVMGSHGHGSLRHAMIGDTVRRVMRISKIPVLVIRVPEEKE